MDQRGAPGHGPGGVAERQVLLLDVALPRVPLPAQHLARADTCVCIPGIRALCLPVRSARDAPPQTMHRFLAFGARTWHPVCAHCGAHCGLKHTLHSKTHGSDFYHFGAHSCTKSSSFRITCSHSCDPMLCYRQLCAPLCVITSLSQKKATFTSEPPSPTCKLSNLMN